MNEKKTYATIGEYIALQPAEHRAALEKIRKALNKAVPGAQEVISYQMPALKYNGMIAWFALFKDHYSLFIRPDFHERFKKQLAGYTQTKSAIHFPFGSTIPVKLIGEIAKAIAVFNVTNALLKKTAGKKKKKA